MEYSHEQAVADGVNVGYDDWKPSAKAGENGEITYEQEEFRLRGEGESGSIIFLGNAYQDVCSAPAELREKDQAVRAKLVRSSAGNARGIPGHKARPASGLGVPVSSSS